MTADPQVFPVIGAKGDEPKFIRRDALSEQWAWNNHSQTLDELARRGGLDPTEIVANIERRRWTSIDWRAAVEAIRQYEVKP